MNTSAAIKESPRVATRITPKRIAIDARFYRHSTAGVGRYTRGLIHHLLAHDPANHYTIILTPADYAEWPKDKQPKNCDVKILDIVHYSRGEQLELLHYLNEQKFDLVHFAMFNHPLLYKGKFVVTIHDLTMTLFPLRPLWHPRTWAYRFVMWHAAQAAQHIIVPSQATKSDVHRMLHVPTKKITITLEAVEPEFVPQHDSKRFTELRQKFGITKPFLFFVNAWRPHKGLPDLVQAFMELNDPNLQLVISGKPNASFPNVATAVHDAQNKNPNVLTPGFISDEDMVSLYSMATAFVFPSHYEGFGLGAIEAISCGCPTLVARNSSLPEATGDAALFFDTGNIKQLKEAITKVTSDAKLRQDMRHKGLEHAKNFSFDTMAQETLAVYQQVLAE